MNPVGILTFNPKRYQQLSGFKAMKSGGVLKAPSGGLDELCQLSYWLCGVTCIRLCRCNVSWTLRRSHWQMDSAWIPGCLFGGGDLGAGPQRTSGKGLREPALLREAGVGSCGRELGGKAGEIVRTHLGKTRGFGMLPCDSVWSS